MPRNTTSEWWTTSFSLDCHETRSARCTPTPTCPPADRRVRRPSCSHGWTATRPSCLARRQTSSWSTRRPGRGWTRRGVSSTMGRLAASSVKVIDDARRLNERLNGTDRGAYLSKLPLPPPEKTGRVVIRHSSPFAGGDFLAVARADGLERIESVERSRISVTSGTSILMAGRFAFRKRCATLVRTTLPRKARRRFRSRG